MERDLTMYYYFIKKIDGVKTKQEFDDALAELKKCEEIFNPEILSFVYQYIDRKTWVEI